MFRPRHQCFFFALFFFCINSFFSPGKIAWALHKKVQTPQSLFKIAVYQNLKSPWHPVFKSSFHDLYLEHFMIEPLFILDKNKQWVCRLCEKPLEFGSENKKSRAKNWLKLKFSTQAKWGDGKEISLEDILFSKKVFKKAARNTVGKKFFEYIEKIELEKSSQKIQIFFKRGKFPSQFLGSFFILPSHLEKKAWLKAKGDFLAFKKESLYLQDPYNKGLYYGRYVPQKERNNKDLILKKNPSRHTESSQDKFLVTQLNSSHLQNSINFYAESGCGKPLCSLEKKLGLQNIAALVKGEYKWIFLESTVLDLISFNLRSPKVQELELRKALAHSLNKLSFLEKCYDKQAIFAASFIHPNHAIKLNQIQFYDYDRKKSQGLLKELSNEHDKNKTMSLELMTDKDQKSLCIAQIFKRDLLSMGINLNVKSYSYTLFKEKLKKLDYTDLALYSLYLPSKLNLSSLFHSKSIPHFYNHYQGANLFSFYDVSVNNLLKKIEKKPFSKLRTKLSMKVHRQIMHELPLLPLVFRLKKTLVKKDFKQSLSFGNEYPSSLWLFYQDFSAS